MKILFITSSSINGGAQKHIRDMFRCFMQSGDDVYIAAPKGWLLDELSEYGDRCRPIENSLRSIPYLTELIRELQPEITNTFILSGGCLGVAAWKNVRCGKIFVTVNNPVIYEGISSAGRLLYPLLYRWMSRYAAAFLVKSDTVREEVSCVIRQRKPVVSIKNGIDFSVFDKDAEYPDLRRPLGLSGEDVVISNIAALNERKGQRYLIDAVCALRARYPVHLLLVGEGPEKDAYQQLVAHSCAESFVHFLGRRSDINCILANSDIFVLPSLHEGLPNALMEGMAMGLPCVATDVGGVRQLIPDDSAGLVVSSKSASQLETALEQVLQHRDSAATMGKAASQRMRTEYSLYTAASQLKEFYLQF